MYQECGCLSLNSQCSENDTPPDNSNYLPPLQPFPGANDPAPE